VLASCPSGGTARLHEPWRRPADPRVDSSAVATTADGFDSDMQRHLSSAVTQITSSMGRQRAFIVGGKAKIIWVYGS
jgi:hypothetical protein